MSRERILQLYNNYALVIGVTSYKLVAGRLHQTWFTRVYTLAINTVQLLSLPLIFWITNNELVRWFHNFVLSTTYLMYFVSCAVIFYTVISRGYRDSALFEVERIVSKLKLMQAFRLCQIKRNIRSYLGILFYLKFATMVYLCVSSLAMCFFLPSMNWGMRFCNFILFNAMNIPGVATYRYYLALWNVACCYQYINFRVKQITRLVRRKCPTSDMLNELSRLWFLHDLLRRCTLRVNKVYGLLMLAARFDYLTFSVVDGYWGLLFWFTTDVPIYLIILGTLNHCVRSLDFYLMDVMCDLVIEYQGYAHHTASEGIWYKELNAFLLYANTSKMSLWVCGLYTANRKCWFQMLGSIFMFSILLVQFHLLMRDKYSL